MRVAPRFRRIGQQKISAGEFTTPYRSEVLLHAKSSDGKVDSGRDINTFTGS